MAYYTPRARQVVQWSGFLGFCVFLTACAELAADRQREEERRRRDEANRQAGAIAVVLINAMREQAAREESESA